MSETAPFAGSDITWQAALSSTLCHRRFSGTLVTLRIPFLAPWCMWPSSLSETHKIQILFRLSRTAKHIFSGFRDILNFLSCLLAGSKSFAQKLDKGRWWETITQILFYARKSGWSLRLHILCLPFMGNLSSSWWGFSQMKTYGLLDSSSPPNCREQEKLLIFPKQVFCPGMFSLTFPKCLTIFQTLTRLEFCYRTLV